jgi:LmbE family N-acetylglucosaminyl deacetylase
MIGSRILMLATYGMEIVECGGALTKNVRAGGESHAAVLLARELSRPSILAASETLAVRTRFLDFAAGTVTPDVPSKTSLVRVIREVRPDIVICQDPEHSFEDLDPDRRQAMILYLEALALAARDFALEAMPHLAPHPIPSVYYMTPSRPNCLVNVADVWDLKEQAMAQLHTQLTFSAQMIRQTIGEEGIRTVAGPGPWAGDMELGAALHRQMDRAFHLYHGMLTHGRFALAEPYRRDGKFHFEQLIV